LASAAAPRLEDGLRARTGLDAEVRVSPRRDPLDLGQEVPEELWTAVAEALAWAYSVSERAITPNR
jgi:hypothetical protein